MDPYLDRHWGDVRGSLVTYAKIPLQLGLGGDLVARSEYRRYFDDDEVPGNHAISNSRMIIGDEVKRGEYLVSVYRAASGKHGRREGYGLKLRERLPGIRIPLRAGDADIALDLQMLIDRAYESTAYGRTLNYNRECDPPLTGDDASWADQLLRAAGRRS